MTARRRLGYQGIVIEPSPEVTALSNPPPAHPLIPVPSLSAFFQGALKDSAESQRLDADDGTIVYLTHLLTDYARSDRFYDHTEDGIVRRPLVVMYQQANEAESSTERELALQRLADTALFVSSILPHSLQRSPVDVDYYIAMGAAAYGWLSDSGSPGKRVRALRSVFQQLSSRFVDFVDLLAEAAQPRPAANPT